MIVLIGIALILLLLLVLDHASKDHAEGKPATEATSLQLADTHFAKKEIHNVEQTR